MIVTITLNPSLDRILEIRGFAAGATLKARTIRFQPAGKGVNVSRCLWRLGHASIATGFLGEGEQAAYSRSFAGTGVRLDFVSLAAETRRNTTIRDPENGTETHIREEGFSVGESDLAALERKLEQLAKPGDTVLFSGSLPPRMPPGRLARLVRQCKSAGCVVAVDTSGPALAEAVGCGCWLAKPNLDELRELTGRPVASDAEIPPAARAVLRSVEVLLVTMGEQGAYCFSGDSAWKARVAVENARNSVGAGDAFLAGFLAAHDNGLPPDACLRQAVACGAASTVERWAGEISVSNVEELIRRVEMQPAG